MKPANARLVARSKDIIAEMLVRFPTPKGGSRRRVPAVNRGAVQQVIRTKLRSSA